MYPSKLIPYLPPSLVEWYRQAPPGQIHQQTEHSGTLMCLDISGFTRLNRELCAETDDGAEQVAGIVNSVLSVVRQTAEAVDGEILKFAGDAAWLYFKSSIDTEAYFQSVKHQLDTINDTTGALNGRPLSIHAAARTGRFSLVSLGALETRREIELLGPLVQEVYAACDRAARGELETSTANSVDVTVKPPQHTPNRPFPSADLLRSYVPIEVLRRVESAGHSGEVSAEVRNVAVLFVRISKPGGSFDQVELSRIVTRLFTGIQETGGNVARIDPHADGHKLLVLFGAPNADELDTVHALHCADRLVQLNDASLSIQCGVAKGSLLCGEVGDAYRKEYTVIGDAVNLAARLMAAGKPGEVLFDGAVRTVAPPLIVSDETALQLKGIDKPVTAYRLDRIDDHSEMVQSDTDIIGLAREQILLRRAWRRIARQERKHMSLAGPAGSGKTALLQSLVEELGHGQARYIDCKHALLFGRGWLIHRLLQQTFELSRPTPDATLLERIEQLSEERWLPLLNDILDTDWPDNEWTQHLSSELRVNKTARLVASCLRSMAGKRVLIAVDNIERTDELSRELLPLILDELFESRILICLSSRGSIADQFSSASLSEIVLRYPGDDEWWTWFGETFHDGAAERQLFQQLLTTSDGNPRFVREYMRHLLGTGALRPNAIDGRMELLISSVEVRIPKSLSSLHLMQFDRLDEDVRSILKAMAVLGGDVMLASLRPAVPSSFGTHLSDRVTSLCHRGILERNRTGGYRFVSHALAESIYDCLPHSHRRALHELFARQFESQGNTNAAILAHHFFQANSDSEALYYSLVAARQAINAHSVLEASQLLSRCRIVLERSGDDLLHPDQIALYYSLHAEHFLSQGELTAAAAVARRWRRFARDFKRPVEAVKASVELAHALSKQAKYDRTAKLLVAVLRMPVLQEEPSTYVKALYILADTYRRQSRYADADELCRKAISAAESIGDNQTLRRSQNNLGLVLWAEGRLAEAAEVYTGVLERSSSETGMFSRAQTLNNLAIIHWEQGRFVQAEALMTEASTIFRSLGDRLNEAYASGNLAALRKLAGRMTEARELFELADLVFKRNNDEHAHQYTVGNIGELDLIEGDTSSARRRFDEVHLFACKVGDQELEAECKVRLGELAGCTGEIDAGRRMITDAAELAAAIGSTEYRLRAMIALARLHVDASEVQEAERLVDEIARTANEARAILAAREADFLSAECSRLRQDLAHARELYSSTLVWAQQERAFELQLKCLVRLVELEGDADEYLGILNQLAASFAKANSSNAWTRVVNSSYYAHYAATLRLIAPVAV